MNCAKCGAEFYARDRRKTTYYCSRECWYGRNRDVNPPLLEKRTCTNCGIKYSVKLGVPVTGKRPFCSSSCYHKFNRGKNHSQWAGGRWLEPQKGYIKVNVSPGVTRWEHIFFAEKALGRKLKKGEVVHHINGNKTDNRNENLLICTNRYHAELHQRMSMLYAKEHFA
ncbi:MAG: zinc binding loop region of homing endonuclease [Podoviridae sp. ctQNx1]|nr:MAG: zinc binding loop region of homing endonuclease [Podoviridae sp. ctQNx1]UOF78106.1 homing endonuclease [Caudoviricetes sp.]